MYSIDLSTGKSNLLQSAQAEVVLGQLSTFLASCGPCVHTCTRVLSICTGYGLSTVTAMPTFTDSVFQQGKVWWKFSWTESCFSWSPLPDLKVILNCLSVICPSPTRQSSRNSSMMSGAMCTMGVSPWRWTKMLIISQFTVHNHRLGTDMYVRYLCGYKVN